MQIQTPSACLSENFDFSSRLKSLKEESLHNIIANKCDAIFAEVLKECEQSREKAQDLAYSLFSGPRCTRFRDFNMSATALSYLLLDKNLLASDLCQVIKQVFEDLKTMQVPSIESPSSQEASSIRPWPGYPDNTYQDEDLVAVIHGGGKRHIVSFLKGESSSGYRCDSHLHGIFLTPLTQIQKQMLEDSTKVREVVLRTRAPQYATRTPLTHCDEAQVIAGFIPQKYLYSVNNNPYEVVLKQEDASQLNLIFSETIKASVSQLPILIADDFLEKFTKNPELQKRLQESFDRLLGNYF